MLRTLANVIRVIILIIIVYFSFKYAFSLEPDPAHASNPLTIKDWIIFAAFGIVFLKRA